MPEIKKCSVGGQALIEGVMMKSPNAIAMAVRKEKGDIIARYEPYTSWTKRNKFFSLPIVRGFISFIESMKIGVQTMNYATKALELEEEEPSKFEKWLSEKLGKGIEDIVMSVAMVFAVGLSVLLFFVLPSMAGSFIGKPFNSATATNIIEGVTRLLIFFGYLVAVSRMKEIKRVFMYHGAEHKTIACYEHDLPLTVENARGMTRLHPRCGTNYLFLVMMISILFFSLLGFNGHWAIKVLIRIVCLPLVAGISYEVLKVAGASDGLLARIVRWPGLQLQRITTAEPDDKMLEVAIMSFDLAIDPVKFVEKYPDQEFENLENKAVIKDGESSEPAAVSVK